MVLRWWRVQARSSDEHAANVNPSLLIYSLVTFLIRQILNRGVPSVGSLILDRSIEGSDLEFVRLYLLSRLGLSSGVTRLNEAEFSGKLALWSKQPLRAVTWRTPSESRQRQSFYSHYVKKLDLNNRHGNTGYSNSNIPP